MQQVRLFHLSLVRLDVKGLSELLLLLLLLSVFAPVSSDLSLPLLCTVVFDGIRLNLGIGQKTQKE